MVTTVDFLTGELTPLQQARVKLLENREWLDFHIEEVQQRYANQWVAILDCQVAAAAAGYQQLLPAVGDRLEEAVILCVPAGEIARPI